jgi:hypothetical protein
MSICELIFFGETWDSFREIHSLVLLVTLDVTPLSPVFAAFGVRGMLGV